MILRVEFLETPDGAVRPYLVDAATDEVLPGQVACQIDAQPGAMPIVTVTFAVDDRDVQFLPTIQKGPSV